MEQRDHYRCHLSFGDFFLAAFAYVSFSPCHFHDRAEFRAPPSVPLDGVPHRVRHSYGVSGRCACAATAITVLRYVTRSPRTCHASVGQRVAPPVATDNNNNSRLARKIRCRGGSYGPATRYLISVTRKLGLLSSCLATATRRDATRPGVYSERCDAQGDGLSPDLDYLRLRVSR